MGPPRTASLHVLRARSLRSTRPDARRSSHLRTPAPARGVPGPSRRITLSRTPLGPPTRTRLGHAAPDRPSHGSVLGHRTEPSPRTVGGPLRKRPARSRETRSPCSLRQPTRASAPCAQPHREARPCPFAGSGPLAGKWRNSALLSTSAPLLTLDLALIKRSDDHGRALDTDYVFSTLLTHAATPTIAHHTGPRARSARARRPRAP